MDDDKITGKDLLARVATTVAEREARQARRMAVLSILDAVKHTERAAGYAGQAGEVDRANDLRAMVTQLNVVAGALSGQQ